MVFFTATLNATAIEALIAGDKWKVQLRAVYYICMNSLLKFCYQMGKIRFGRTEILSDCREQRRSEVFSECLNMWIVSYVTKRPPKDIFNFSNRNTGKHDEGIWELPRLEERRWQTGSYQWPHPKLGNKKCGKYLVLRRVLETQPLP
jgi:hypothetical protein